MKKRTWIALCLAIALVMANVIGVGAADIAADGTQETGQTGENVISDDADEVTDGETEADGEAVATPHDAAPISSPKDTAIANEARTEHGFEIQVNPKQDIVAGQNETFELSITNITDQELTLEGIMCYYAEKETDSYNVEWGSFSLPDSGKGTVIKSQEAENCTVTGTIPETWSEGSYMLFVVNTDTSGAPGTVNYEGSATYPGQNVNPDIGNEDAEDVYAFDVTLDTDDELKAGNQITVKISVTNITDQTLKLTWLNNWYYQEYDNSETYPGVEFGTLTDSEGKTVTDPPEITFQSDETKTYTLTGTLPSTWGEKSQILIVVGSYNEDKTIHYYGQGELPQFGYVDDNDDVVNAYPTDKENWLKNVLTKEEIAAGYQAEFNSMELLKEDLPDEIVSVFQNAAGKRTIAAYYDMWIYKWIGEQWESGEFVEKLLAPISITLEIPKEYQAANRKFVMIRCHDGVADVLPDTDADAGTITFITDRFSPYALAYQDEAGISSTSNAGGVQTGDMAPITTLMVLMAASAVAASVAWRKRSTR